MAVTSKNTQLQVKTSVDSQGENFTSGATIYSGHPVALGSDGKVYHLESSACDGYAVIGYSVYGAAAANAPVDIEMTSIIELPIKSGVTLIEGDLAYADDNGQLTKTNTDHLVGTVIDLNRSGYAFVKVRFPK